MKKNLMVAATVATIGLTSFGAVGLASAATNTSSSTNGSSSLVDKLVAKFGLKKADVQAVFEAEHTERQAARAQEVADKLAAGVKAGTITQAQSDAITAKIKELKAEREANHESMESKTDAERKAAMDAKRTEIKQWITDNKIPAEFARLLHGGSRGHGGPHGEMAPPAN